MKYIFLVLMFAVGLLNAAEIAVVKDCKGEVFAKNANGMIALTKGSILDENMSVITKQGSMALIIFKDTSTLTLGQNSVINLSKFVFKPTNKEYDFKMFLHKGSLVFESGKIGDLAPQAFELKTPSGIVAIRGTKFAVKVE
ncbi:FecR domain-containing protein [Sulfurimonas sp.]|uniref:FecR family protein n=1 Tax=Sulfurimonas sp. TaxID=2022749 RepID=UPI002619F32C|nr:FecR domain-containing protein [Sulfurimonas sp.]